ncbi:TetR/AcrR family transcriptional regulator [Flexibacterium corallicola]|uniref:TetR/AcrR family transcriptional regulator n=1 Tax=Flexibacterium corallicola TaxID=3037259 RepID=UPI00286F0C40|nr:TetR/AcrR family transcriptional regulator [Pseudovibrio sp. M1P-2-3]
MTKKRLSPDDWIVAGFKALASGGQNALKVEPIARELGTTKGSFYWHFKDLADFKKSMLTRWRVLTTENIIESLKPYEAGGQRLRALVELSSAAPGKLGSMRVEMAVREWARHDDLAAECISEIDNKRIAYVHEEMNYEGPDKEQRARLIYAAHLGLKHLTASTGESGRPERSLLFELLQQD